MSHHTYNLLHGKVHEAARALAWPEHVQATCTSAYCIVYDTISIEIESYEDTLGARPFDRWFDRLPAAHAAKVTAALVRIGLGARSGLKAVGSGVSEWKIDWGPGIRIYLAFDGTKLVILLGGGTKAHQQSDIEEALLRWADYKRRKAEKE